MSSPTMPNGLDVLAGLVAPNKKSKMVDLGKKDKTKKPTKKVKTTKKKK